MCLPEGYKEKSEKRLFESKSGRKKSEKERFIVVDGGSP